jgi:hypothetical protein
MTMDRLEAADGGEATGTDVYDLDAEIGRLRVMLELMAPETGAQALGALRRAAPELPLAERVKLLAYGGQR